jgi:heptosyltransferase-2
VRVLVVQTAYVGDVVLTTPLLAELRRLRPRATIDVLTTAAGAEVLDGHPVVRDRLVVAKRGGPWIASLARWARELPRRRYDAVVAAHRSVRTGMLVWLTGAGLRVGFAGAAGAWAYTARVRRAPDRHAGRRYLELAVPFGGDPDRADALPRLHPAATAIDRVERLLAEHGLGRGEPIAAVVPGSIWPTKRWPADGYAAIVARLADRGPAPVLVGAPGEEALCDEIARESGRRVPVLAGRTSAADLVALAARAVILVGNDSGAAHVAAAVGTPVVAVFGPTSAGAGLAPLGPDVRIVEHPSLACRPCGRHGALRCPLGHLRCMREIRPDDVWAALSDLLRTGRTAALPLARPVSSRRG